MIRFECLDTVRDTLSMVRERTAIPSENHVRFGVEPVDHRIGGGLVRNGLHEIFAASGADGSTVSAFAVALAVQAIGQDKSLLWIREDRGVRNAGRLHAPGLVDLGCDPDRIILVTASDTLGVLRAGADSVKCGRIGAVVLEPWGRAPLFDLTASRRLSMAAAVSGVFMLALRIDAEPVASAAQTRWRVAAAPSAPLGANAPGHPAFDIALLRHRGGIAGFETRLEWNRDARSFAPLSGGQSAVPAHRADQTRKAA